jgi:hypothetical protein
MCVRLLGALLVSCLPVLGVADEVAAQVRATTTAISADRVVLQVVVSNGVTAELTVQNGEMARIRFIGGPFVGLSPVLRQGGARLYVFRIDKGSPEVNERIEQLGTLELDKEAASRFDGGPFPFDVRFIRSYVPVVPQTPQPPGPNGPCTQCCVRCDGIEACACAVKMECGSCCCPEHCGCLDSPTTSTSGTTGGCSAGARIAR